MKKIYLAGKLSGIPLQEQKGWRDYLKKQLEDTGNFKVLSPCDYYSYEKKEHKSEREIMNWELNYVKNSDIIIVNLDKADSSVGTIMELATAHNLGKPIIGYGKLEGHHPWIQEVIWRTEDSLENVIYYISRYFAI